MIDFMAELRGRGLRMALLTNNVREWEPLWRAKLPELDDIFELVVDSAFVGMRKPEPEIYELTLERLGGGLTRHATACSWTTSSPTAKRPGAGHDRRAVSRRRSGDRRARGGAQAVSSRLGGCARIGINE